MEGNIIGVNSYDLQELVEKVVELNKVLARICGISDLEMSAIFDDVTNDRVEKYRNGKRCINLDTLEQFDSLKLAARSIGIENSSSEMSAVCSGKVPNLRGHHFAYYDDYVSNTIPEYKGKMDEALERGRKLADAVSAMGVTNQELADYMCQSSKAISAFYTKPTEETVEKVLNAAKKIAKRKREDIWWKCKRYMKEKGVHGYEVALVMGIKQPELSRRLRNADEALYEQIVSAVSEILQMQEEESREE